MSNSYIESNFREIFNTFYESVCRFLNLYTKDKDLIEDIVQDVFVNLWQSRNSIQMNNIKAYLFSAARNRILNHLRNINLHQQLLESWNTDEANLIDANECVDNAEFENHLQRAIDQLPAKCHKVFILSKYNKMTYKKIAIQENISEKMVEKHISTALRKIKQFIRQSMSSIILLCFFVF